MIALSDWPSACARRYARSDISISSMKEKSADAVPASGLDPGAAPDWRLVAPSSARRFFATPQFSCTRNERDWFLYLAYSAGERPGTVLRRREAESTGSGGLEVDTTQGSAASSQYGNTVTDTLPALASSAAASCASASVG